MKLVPFYTLATILLSSTAYANVVCDADGNCIASKVPPVAAPVAPPSYTPPPGYQLTPVVPQAAIPVVPPGYQLTPVVPQAAIPVVPPGYQLTPIPASPPVVVVRPALAFAPSWMKMTCYPNDSSPYEVRYYGESGRVDITGTITGSITRRYPIIDRQDSTSSKILYVAARRGDQNRTMYFAFDYSPDRDVSDIRVKGFDGNGRYYDDTDKCYLSS
jgi:hypothetical protein